MKVINISQTDSGIFNNACPDSRAEKLLNKRTQRWNVLYQLDPEKW